MRTRFLVYALFLLFVLPCSMRAEEVEIVLLPTLEMGAIGGDGRLDVSDKETINPTEPTSFHATIDGRTLSITKQEPAIASAQAIVVKATTGNVVLNQSFVDSLSEQISESGVYVLNIETDGGSLVGRFIVQ